MTSEREVQARIMLALGRGLSRVFRNNVGVLPDATGRPIRYGLCTGSSDLIGWTSQTITAEMVGKQVAVFTAVEVKNAKGRATSEQRAFLTAVTQAGGIAGVCRSPEEAMALTQTLV